MVSVFGFFFGHGIPLMSVELNIGQEKGKGEPYRLEDGLLKDVQAPRLQSNPNRLFVLVIIQAPLEHLVNDALQTRIDALFLLLLRKLCILHTQLCVMIDALGCCGTKGQSDNEALDLCG